MLYIIKQKQFALVYKTLQILSPRTQTIVKNKSSKIVTIKSGPPRHGGTCR